MTPRCLVLVWANLVLVLAARAQFGQPDSPLDLPGAPQRPSWEPYIAYAAPSYPDEVRLSPDYEGATFPNLAPSRPSIRPRFQSLSPIELLQRATAARESSTTENPLTISPLELIKIARAQGQLPTSRPTPAPAQTEAPFIDTTPVAQVTNRSYRKSYGGRRSQQQDSSNIKELLKQSGTQSLSELLQQRNLSLVDLLQGKKHALSVLGAKESKISNEPPPSTETTFVDRAPPSIQNKPEKVATEVNERVQTRVPYITSTSTTPEPYRALLPSTTKRPIRDATIFNTNRRQSYLQSKRQSTTNEPITTRIDTQRWPTKSPISDAEETPRKRGDSREDILELLKPGSPVSLAQLLSSRNMTLAELMEHRERGSRQQQLSDLFSDVLQNKTKPALESTREAFILSPSRSQNTNVQAVLPSYSTVKPRGSRDPRLLDLPRRTTYPPFEEDIKEKEDEVTTSKSREVVDHYDYVDEEEEEEIKNALPTSVKSAIWASAGLLVLTLTLFATIFVCCKLQQRKRRGTRVPFLRGSLTTKSSRSVVIIKPVDINKAKQALEF